jgi:hypothetical protein
MVIRRNSKRVKSRRGRRPVAQTVANGPGTDQTLLDLVNGLREIAERVGILEHRFDALGTSAAIDPDGEDVMDLRLHVARLSAEVSRVTVGLEARIAEVASHAGVAMAGDPVSATLPTASLPIPTPALAGDETFEDLTADSPARARGANSPSGKSTARRTSGWQPAD